MLNKPLLKATLKVILDGQATLYASIMTKTGDWSSEDYEKFVTEYKSQTAQLILEAMDEAQDDTSSKATT